MELQNLTKLNEKKNKRIGRGHGSGRGGHTSTRGHKGQKARGSISLFFEGTKLKKSLIKRLPLYRGKNKFKSFQKETLVVNLKHLNLFKEGEIVDFDSLIKKGILSKKITKDTKIKILGEGELKMALSVSLPCSKKAEEKITKAGGKVVGR